MRDRTVKTRHMATICRPQVAVSSGALNTQPILAGRERERCPLRESQVRLRTEVATGEAEIGGGE